MLLDPTLTKAYIIISILLVLSPGPDFLFVLSNAIQHQVKGAIAATFGVAAGLLFHSILAAIGVSALIAAQPVLFDFLRYGGALYLGYLGVHAMWLFWQNKTIEHEDYESSLFTYQIFKRAFIINVMNPKIIIFYLALLPQFVSIELGHIGLQIFLLGLIHNGFGVIFLIAMGAAVGHGSRWLVEHNFGRWTQGISGVFFIGLAIRIILSS